MIFMKEKSVRYFAAANSRGGFFSLFGEVFAPESFKTVYIIKGGSGTGKSTMMKRVGNEAERRGFDVEYVLCSSDPSSLDGIVIPALSVSVLDGTAPHTTDPKYPAAAERVIDLYGCIDGEKIKTRREEIISESKTAARHTAAAYGFLRALGEINDEEEALASVCFKCEKAERAARGILKKLSRGGEYRRLFSSAVCSNGLIREKSFLRSAKEKMCVTVKYGAEYAFMTELRRAAKTKGIGFTEVLSPVRPEKTEGLYFEQDGLYVSVSDGNENGDFDKKINVMRFIDREKLSDVRGRLRFSEKCASAVLDGAVGCFAGARACHEKLERIYGDATDFSLVDKIREKLIKEIFG